jgi:hypothetical protein
MEPVTEHDEHLRAFVAEAHRAGWNVSIARPAEVEAVCLRLERRYSRLDTAPLHELEICRQHLEQAMRSARRHLFS